MQDGVLGVEGLDFPDCEAGVPGFGGEGVSDFEVTEVADVDETAVPGVEGAAVTSELCDPL